MKTSQQIQRKKDVEENKRNLMALLNNKPKKN